MNKRTKIHKPVERTRTLKIVLPLLLLLAVGLTMIYDASVIEAQEIYGSKYYFIKQQVVWVLLGLGMAYVVSRIPIKWLTKMTPIMFIGSLGLLFAVLIPGIGSAAHGAQRWLKVGGMSFQPAEIVKVATVLYLASWFTRQNFRGAKISTGEKSPRLGPFLVLVGFILLLLMLQPDLGTALVILTTAFYMLFLSGVKLRIMGGLGILGILGMVGLILVSPYRMKRLTAFLNPTQDPLGSGYHINQALISLGSGGWWGVGLGRSRQKFQYLPEAATDSIFAVIGEEMGFLGGGLVVVLFGVFFWQLFKIAGRESGAERKMIAAGLTGWLAFQTLINLGGMVALIPFAGVPLPFISYGRSSLIAQLMSVGILLRISLTQK